MILWFTFVSSLYHRHPPPSSLSTPPPPTPFHHANGLNGDWVASEAGFALGGVVYVVIDVSLGLSLWGACGVGGVGCQCMDVRMGGRGWVDGVCGVGWVSGVGE